MDEYKIQIADDAGAQDARPAREPLRVARAVALAAMSALFLLVLALCITRTTDTDLFWHLASGDLIRRTGQIPHAEPFSYTAMGHRWIDIHWLLQVVLSFLYEKGGTVALDVLRCGVIIGVFAFLFRRCRRAAGPATVVAGLLLAVLACQERFFMRPEIVSWALMLAVLAAVERALAAPARSARAGHLFVVVPILQILWVNVQGLFILGPVLILLGLATALFDLVRARARPAAARDPDRPLDFFIALALSALASLVNPYAAGALRLPFEQFFDHLGGRSLLSRTIVEFQPPLSGYLVTPSIVAFVVLAAVTLLAILADFPRVRMFDLLVTIATLTLALRARRNIPIFALATAPLLARHGAAALAAASARLRGLPWFVARKPAGERGRVVARAPLAVIAPALLAVVALALVFDVASNRFFLRWPTERWFGSGEIPYYFPEESARFVAGGGIAGNVFHSLWSGGYLIHAWHGERPVFIDGRNDPYLEDVLPSYLRAIADPAAFEEAARRYQITTVLWPHQRALEGRVLLGYLARGHGWTLIHLDPAGAVYLRADLLTPARLTEGPFPPDRDRLATYVSLARRLEEKRFQGPPIREIALGEFFSVSGDAPGAEFFYRRALERLPGNAAVLYGLALSLERQKKTKEARASFAVAAAAGYVPARAAMGAYLLEEGRTREAERELDAAYGGGDRSARLLESRARLFEQKGDIARAIRSYRDALRQAPRDTALLRSLALFYVRHDEPDAALPFYTTAAQADPDDPTIAREMAALLERLGRTGAALDVIRDAARRALDRLESGGMGPWARGAAGRDEDLRVLLLAAHLETKAGDPSKAAAWLEALKKAEAAKARGIQ